MSKEPAAGTLGPEQLLLGLVEALETAGVDMSETTLQDYFDVDALDRLIRSSDGISVEIEVEGVRLAITPSDIVAKS